MNEATPETKCKLGELFYHCGELLCCTGVFETMAETTYEVSKVTISFQPYYAITGSIQVDAGNRAGVLNGERLGWNVKEEILRSLEYTGASHAG